MSSHQGLILLKRPNMLVPKEYLDLVLPKYQTGMGVALVEGSAITMDTVDQGVPTDAFMEMQEKIKKELAIFYFANFPAGYMKDDIQPFTLLSSEAGNPLIVGFMDGDFSRFHQDKSDHSDEFHMANRLLVPKFQQLWRLCGENMTKFLEEIRGPLIKQELISGKTKREHILLLTNTKESVGIFDNALKADFPWGVVSNHHGYVEGENKTVSEKPSGGLFSKLASSQFGKSAVHPAKNTTLSEQAILQQDVKNADALKTSTALHPDAGTSIEKDELPDLISPPASIPMGKQGKNQLKSWYRNNFGTLPEKYLSDRPALPRSMLLRTAPLLRSLENVGSLVKPKSSDAPAQPAAVPGTGPQPEPHVAPKAPEVKGDEDGPIIIPPAALKDIEALYKSFGADPILDPSKIQSLEAPKPTYSTQTGLAGLETTFGWSEERWKQIADLDKKHGSYMMVLAVMQYRYAYLSELATQPVRGKDTETKHVQPASTKAEETVRKGGVFGNLKRAG
jgi:hypothetical protein